MKITGELLKSERIRLKLSQQDIAFSLKLSPRIIDAIEAGDIENLPAKTFVRGFVKSYAEMLKLDSALVLNQYHEEMGTGLPINKVSSAPSAHAKVKSSNLEDVATKHTAISSVTPNLKMSLNRNTLKITALIAMAVVVLGGINQVVTKYQKEGAAPEPQNLSVETLNQEANAPKELTSSPAPSGEITSAESLAVAASATPKAAPNTTPSPTPTLATSTPAPGSTGKAVELIIEASKDTNVAYAIGDETEFKTLVLKKDSIQIIKSKNGLHLKLDEGNAVSITVNGINKGMASSDAKPIELSF